MFLVVTEKQTSPLSILISNVQARESIWPNFTKVCVSDVKNWGQGLGCNSVKLQEVRVLFSEWDIMETGADIPHGYPTRVSDSQ